MTTINRETVMMCGSAHDALALGEGMWVCHLWADKWNGSELEKM